MATKCSSCMHAWRQTDRQAERRLQPSIHAYACMNVCMHVCILRQTARKTNITRLHLTSTTATSESNGQVSYCLTDARVCRPMKPESVKPTGTGSSCLTDDRVYRTLNGGFKSTLVVRAPQAMRFRKQTADRASPGTNSDR